MTSASICIISLLGCLFCSGCAHLLDTSKDFKLPDFVKSSEQIKLENAKKQLKEARETYKCKVDELTAAVTRKVSENEYRRRLLEERMAYVAMLKEEYNEREAILDKKAKEAGYFALGTKGIGIASGISSAILVAASPANAAIVAGLAALSTGTIAFQDTASKVGYSTIIALGQSEALKEAVNKAYLKFAESPSTVPWSCLYAYDDRQCASQANWDTAINTLQDNIVRLEAAVRYTKFEWKFTATE